jgi:hypothetical protein
MVCESGETNPRRKWSDAISYTLNVLVRSHPGGCISKKSTRRSAQASNRGRRGRKVDGMPLSLPELGSHWREVEAGMDAQPNPLALVRG